MDKRDHEAMNKDSQKEKSIYDLGLHEKINISLRVYAQRVPGGWIYYESHYNIATFVPFNNEFQESQS